LAYGKEAIILMDFIMPIMHVPMINDLSESSIVEERFSQFVQLEEDQFSIGFHQQVNKAREKE
jgi:hypothetical protein